MSRYNRSYDHPVYRAARRRLRGQPCHYCGTPSDTVDHATPLALGGTNTTDNLVPCCASCNSSRGAKLKAKLNRKSRRERNLRYR